MDWLREFHALIGEGPRDILWWQMAVRAILTFLYGLLLLRLLGWRAFGKQNPLDLAVAIMVGSNLSRAVTGNARFLPTLAATAALVALFWLFDYLAVRWTVFGRLVKGRPVPLVRNGEFDRDAMRRTGVSDGDVAEAARLAGIASLDGLKDAVLERSGKISAVPRP
jgi:uncharacterized membrane protein YcaP (DUF421 family)